MRNIYAQCTYEGTPNVTRTFSLKADPNSEGRLVGPLTFNAVVRTWLQSARTAVTVSNIKIVNADGALDSLADETWIDFKIIENVNNVQTTLASGLIERVFLDGERFLNFKILDALKQLDKPIQDSLFPATEPEIDGTGTKTLYSLENQPRPLCFGLRSRSIKPTLTQRSNNEYVCHDDDVFSVVAVYDNGVSVGFTQHASGFVLSADPVGRIVADVQGEENAAGTNRIFRFAEIMEYLLTTRESISYNTTDATAIDTAKAYRYSYYQDETTNRSIREVLQWHCDSHTGWFYGDENGVIRFGYLQEPSATADVEIGELDIINEIKINDDTAPNITTLLGAARNWFIYNVDDIAASVTEEFRQQLSNQFRATLEATNTIDEFYESTGLIFDTLVRSSDGQTEINNVTNLYSTKRKFYEIDSVKLANIGDTVQVTDERFGLSSGVNLLCIGYEIDFITNIYKLYLWG